MADLMAGTGAALIAFLDYTGEKGLVNDGTAKATKVAVREILKQAEGEGWESKDVRGLDVEDVQQRFDNRTAGKFSPKSRQAYHGRFRRAVTMYGEFLKDPGGWRPIRQSGASPPTPRRRTNDRPKQSTTASGNTPPPPADEPHELPDMMTYPHPLRRDGTVIFARLILPNDLTTKEAERIAAHLKALAVDDPPSNDPPSRDEPATPTEDPF